MKILFIHNSTGSRLYRILPQAKYMATQGHDCKVRGLKGGKTGGVKDVELQWADLVVLEMTYSPSFIKACKKHGCRVVYEIDDLMQKVTKKHYAHKDMNWWRTFLTYYCLMKSDALSVTCNPLSNAYKWFTSRIDVLPNYLDLEFWEKPHLPNTSDKIRIGWIGGNSHTEDLEWIAPVMKEILTKYPNVKFISTGHGGTPSEDDWVKFNYGEYLFGDLPEGQYEYSLGSPMEVFPSKIAAMRLDIGIAPVVENVFSRCKTPCKALEYGINRIPGVYSEFLYKRHNAVVDGKTGFLVGHSHKEWVEKLSELIENATMRKQMGENAYLHIKENFDFNKHAHKWEKLYNETCNTQTSKTKPTSWPTQTTTTSQRPIRTEPQISG